MDSKASLAQPSELLDPKADTSSFDLCSSPVLLFGVAFPTTQGQNTACDRKRSKAKAYSTWIPRSCMVLTVASDLKDSMNFKSGFVYPPLLQTSIRYMAH